ncbi:transporter [Paenibacillus pectinilyticus]|uniref:Transporter n=1 Tax=Paenibacillus pectinilyticus TaxID=512399 RepID=A0A1C0ZV83_9BACL|nr:amino acid permease [Paenibacillus pectinilyticus]OCT12016.1 transporter [Paenibacillus pectinilyticus]
MPTKATKTDPLTTGTMNLWQLSLLGVACTLGTGYFLGAGIGLTMGGASMLILFLLAAVGTYFVLDALIQMTNANPQQGSFRAYAQLAYGRWAGFSCGWIYWGSQLMIMGSQLAALSLFTRFWFPAVPMWLFAVIYASLGVGVILLGAKAFERSEHFFALIKVSALLMFLLIAAAAIVGWISGGLHPLAFPITHATFLPSGLKGSWSSFIYAFYAFGGTEMMGLFAMRLKKPSEASKAGTLMILLLAILYIISLFLVLTLLPLHALHEKKSPFQVSLESYPLPFVPHVFNAILIIAAFSTMVASLFAVTAILVALAQDHDAPLIFARKTKGVRQIPYAALAFTTGGMAAAVVLALILPENLYTFISTAAGLTLLFIWLFILLSSGRLLPRSSSLSFKRWSGILLILCAISGAACHPTTRPGFWISLLFILLIALITYVLHLTWRPNSKKRY